MVKDDKTVIILVSGKAEAGKDTVSRIIAESCELSGVRIVHFATPVKKVAKELGWDGEKDEKGRSLLQWLGDGVKKFNPTLWAEKAYKTVNGFKRIKMRVFVFPDCRYHDEVSYFKDRFSHVYVLRVVRNGHVSKLTDEQKFHPSECDLDNYDFDAIVHNDGVSLANLVKNTSNSIKKIRILGSF